MVVCYLTLSIQLSCFLNLRNFSKLCEYKPIRKFGCKKITILATLSNMCKTEEEGSEGEETLSSVMKLISLNRSTAHTGYKGQKLPLESMIMISSAGFFCFWNINSKL